MKYRGRKRCVSPTGRLRDRIKEVTKESPGENLSRHHVVVRWKPKVCVRLDRVVTWSVLQTGGNSPSVFTGEYTGIYTRLPLYGYVIIIYRTFRRNGSIRKMSTGDQDDYEFIPSDVDRILLSNKPNRLESQTSGSSGIEYSPWRSTNQ